MPVLVVAAWSVRGSGAAFVDVRAVLAGRAPRVDTLAPVALTATSV